MVYLGLGDVGAALWEQQIRVLQKVASIEHEALPQLIDGGSVPASDPGKPKRVGAAYILTKSYERITDGESHSLADYFNGALEDLKGTHREALQRFWLLADALAMLHDARIAHRNLWPGTLDYETAEDNTIRLRITRFEMSAMVANLLTSRRFGNVSTDIVRTLYLNQEPRSFAYMPPERAAFVLGNADDAGIGGAKGDVFSLGMMVAEWLLGRRLLDNVPTTSVTDLLQFQKQARRRIGGAKSLPAALVSLLQDMIDPTERSRPPMADVVKHLSGSIDSYLESVDPREAAMPYLVAFMRQQSDKTLLPWGSISQSGTTDEGEDELIGLIEPDLASAAIAHSRDGAAGYVSIGDPDRLADAKTVLFGHQFVWFASVLWKQSLGKRRYFEKVLLLRYVVKAASPSPQLSALRAQALKYDNFRVKAISHDIDADLIEAMSLGRPSWDELQREVQRQLRPTTGEAQAYLESLDWLLYYQAARRLAREFAFVRDEDAGASGGETVLRWDRDNDAKRRHSLSALHSKLIGNRKLRPAMGDFFAESDGDGEVSGIEVEIWRDYDGSPDLSYPPKRYRLGEVRGSEIIVVKTYGSEQIPPKGWVRLASDSATAINERNQLAAKTKLATNRVLLGNLVRPRGRLTHTERWSSAGGELEGEGRDAVRRMLSTEPLFALQGPPGTGKTAVTAETVATYLQAEPGARILVSAQSHDALDNVAVRILEKIGAIDSDGKPLRSDFLALRVGSDWSLNNIIEQSPLREFIVTRAVPREKALISKHVRGWLSARRTDNPKLTAILAKYLTAIAHSDFELWARVRRGANVIFATTGASTEARLIDQGSGEPFDWVFVEEAAKAWPTELIMPLVHGLRWSVVGDHAQIGAFGRHDVEKFLDSCRDDPDPEVAGWWGNQQQLLRTFDTFASLFDPNANNQARLQLTQQRRMRQPIADVVSRAFYSANGKGQLSTVRSDEDHGINEPSWLRDQALVWLDTEQTERAVEFWSNEVEARIIANLVRALRPRFNPDQDLESLAIITPYRAQVDELRKNIGEAQRFIHTVDAFQGRQADVVITSLVRDRPAKAATIFGSLGHLADPARVNVMLSRARNLLVIVGRLELFENCDSNHWREVVNGVRESGVVVKLSESTLL
jgi:hypothetical protein